MPRDTFVQHWNHNFKRDISALNMHILQLATVDLAPNWKMEGSCQPYVRMYYIQSGEAEIHYRDKQIPLVPGNIYLIPSNLNYGYSCPDECFKLFCHFTLLRHDNQDMFSRVSECIILEDRMKEINEAIELFQRADARACVCLKALLFRHACEGILKADIDFSQFVEHSPLIDTALAIIHQNCRITLSAKAIAESLCITAPALQKQFKKEVGQPIGKYIKEQVLRRAEDQIRHTNRPIKEISEGFGFSDQFYFSRLFKGYFLFSPSSVRKK